MLGTILQQHHDTMLMSISPKSIGISWNPLESCSSFAYSTILRNMIQENT
jgi:hypothetical protein